MTDWLTDWPTDYMTDWLNLQSLIDSPTDGMTEWLLWKEESNQSFFKVICDGCKWNEANVSYLIRFKTDLKFISSCFFLSLLIRFHLSFFLSYTYIHVHTLHFNISFHDLMQISPRRRVELDWARYVLDFRRHARTQNCSTYFDVYNTLSIISIKWLTCYIC